MKGGYQIITFAGGSMTAGVTVSNTEVFNKLQKAKKAILIEGVQIGNEKQLAFFNTPEKNDDTYVVTIPNGKGTITVTSDGYTYNAPTSMQRKAVK